MLEAHIIRGDCVEVMHNLIADGVRVDAVVTDPPYHLQSIVKRFGSATAAPAQHGTDGAFARASRGFMGQAWDGGDIAFRRSTWRACFDLLPPGGHLVAFGGDRTWHRIACAIEDSGFEIRRSLAWLYGTGMAKSHNVVDLVRKSGDDAGEAALWDGWETDLKPALEPIILARKPLDGTVAQNVLTHGVGGLNVDACRLDTNGERRAIIERNAGASDRGTYKPGPAGGRQVGETDLPKWPPNVLRDGSREVRSAFLRFAKGSASPARFFPSFADAEFQDQLSFHYSGKANADDRRGLPHPTIKPRSLMRWLCRLICPPGGLVLDPFAGSGTTGEAALAEGMRALLIEQEESHFRACAQRLAEVEREHVEATPPLLQLMDGDGDAA